jgi:hypothetical protein
MFCATNHLMQISIAAGYGGSETLCTQMSRYPQLAFNYTQIGGFHGSNQTLKSTPRFHYSGAIQLSGGEFSLPYRF